MKKDWKEKTTLEKTVDIITVIAVIVFFGVLIVGKSYDIKYADLIDKIAIAVICLCQAFAFREEKRQISNCFAAAAILIIASLILGFFA